MQAQHKESVDPRSDEDEAGKSNVDGFLYRNLVEMVPLGESLIVDGRAKSSFNRRASVVYTRAPSRESVAKKKEKTKKRPTVPAKKPGTDSDLTKNVNEGSRDSWPDDMSASSLKKISTERDRSELEALQKQVGDLQKKLLEMDEIIKPAEDSMNQMNMIHMKINHMASEAAEKYSLVKSAQMQLSDSQAELADKQTCLEKMQWELMTSKTESEKLQHDLGNIQWEAGVLVQAVKSFTEEYSIGDAEKHSNFDYLDHLVSIEEEKPIDEGQMQQMESARLSYIDALAYAKENPSEEALALVVEARQQLSCFA